MQSEALGSRLAPVPRGSREHGGAHSESKAELGAELEAVSEGVPWLGCAWAAGAW